jgi:hypothetical protein
MNAVIFVASGSVPLKPKLKMIQHKGHRRMKLWIGNFDVPCTHKEVVSLLLQSWVIHTEALVSEIL